MNVNIFILSLDNGEFFHRDEKSSINSLSNPFAAILFITSIIAVMKTAKTANFAKDTSICW
jgi:hypothetical protein